MEAYKTGQGTLARLIAAFSLAIMAALGCIELYSQIQARGDEALLPGEVFASLPLLGVPLSLKFLLCLAVLAALGYGIRRWLARPKVVDILIETESELKKVSWPTRQESWNASMVVVGVSLLLCLLLFSFDWLLSKFFGLIY
ncbi:MAG: preprotein translocase subunit SecE [Planctomycetaceae bacterium]